MAISTYMTFLMYNSTPTSTATWTKVAPIKSYGDLGGDPETIDTTDLEKSVRTSIPGVQEADNVAFTHNYVSADFKACKDLEGTEHEFAVWFGGTKDESTGAITPTGANGKVEWTGYLTAWITGGGVNEPVEFTSSISVSSDFKFTEATTQG